MELPENPGMESGSQNRASIRMPLWALALGLLTVGGLLGACITLILSNPSAPEVRPASAEPASSTATRSDVATLPPTLTPSPADTDVASTPTPTVPSREEPSKEPDAGATAEVPLEPISTPDPPIGTLAVLSNRDGVNYGQGFPSENCANWMLGLVNQSNAAISKVIFAPPDGAYTNYSGWDGEDFPEIPADPPEPAVIEVYLLPGQATDVRFQTCTSTPAPDEADFEFGATAPDTVTFQWESGYEGEVCFRC